MTPIRIAITGPESSGKTALTEALGKALNCGWVPEFARAFLEMYGNDYEQEDLDTIAEGHWNQIQESSENPVLVDTDFVVLKVWSEYKYNGASATINRLVNANHFDLHILCAPDIPWHYDPLRENPADRDVLFEQYLKILETFRKPYIIVAGTHAEREKKSLDAILKLI